MGGLSRKIGIAMVAAAGVVATLTGANAADMSLGAAAPLPSIAQPAPGLPTWRAGDANWSSSLMSTAGSSL